MTVNYALCCPAVTFKLLGDNKVYDRPGPLGKAAWNRAVKAAEANPADSSKWSRRKQRQSFRPREIFVPVGGGDSYKRVTEL
jgi:hypothetical protein